MTFALGVSDGLHLERFDEFEFVHESFERVGPSFTNGLDEFSLHIVDGELGESSSFGDLGSVLINERFGNTGLRVVTDDAVLDHVVDNDVLASFKWDFTSVDVEVTVLGFLIRVRDTSEVGNDSSSSLLVESLDITSFANLEGGRDVAFDELEAGISVECLGEVSVLGVGADESDEYDASGHAEKLRYFRDSSNVFSSVFSRESETLVESSSDDISIEDEDLLVVSESGVQVLLDGFSESRFSGSRESSEPEGGASLWGVGG